MTTLSQATPAIAGRPSLLRRAMRGNAIFSLISGLTFALFSQPLSTLLGIPWPTALLVVGVMLIIYAADLAWVTSSEQFDIRWGMVAVALDAVWVIGSAVILMAGLLPLTTLGWWTVAIAADIVLLFAVAQAIGIRRIQQAA